MAMTQHINLLTRHRGRKSMAWLANGGLGGLALVCLVWAGVAEINLQRLASAHADMQKKVDTLTVVLNKKRREAGLEDAQALAKDSAQIRRSMDEHRQLMELVQKGEIGNLQGHSAALQTLATTPQAGAWLQGVEISKAGQAMRVTGSALTTAAALQYAQQLNQSFKAVGVEFTALELAKEDVPATAGVAKSTVIKFKLD
jgi:hypothetical protein